MQVLKLFLTLLSYITLIICTIELILIKKMTHTHISKFQLNEIDVKYTKLFLNQKLIIYIINFTINYTFEYNKYFNS